MELFSKQITLKLVYFVVFVELEKHQVYKNIEVLFLVYKYNNK